MQLLCLQDNHRLPASSHTAAKSRDIQQDQIQEVADENRKRQAASIRESLAASYHSYSLRSETCTDHDSYLRSLEKEVGSRQQDKRSGGGHGSQSRLSQRRNVDLLVTTQRQSIVAGGASAFRGDKVSSSAVVSGKPATGDLGEWSMWPSQETSELPVKPESDGGWGEMALLHPVAAMRALAMGSKMLAEEVQRETKSIDVQKDAQTQR